MQRPFRHPSITAAAVATVLVLSGCGGDDNKDAAPAAGATTSAAAAATTSAAAAGAKLAVTKSGTLGDLVVDAQGFTLYRFDNDTNNPSKSNCTGGCLATWPPAITSGQPAATGVDPSSVGTLKLADGTEQITLGGWPLYRFAPDAKPGDTAGQGVGGIWWAVTPKGEKATAAPSAAAAPERY